MLNNSSACNSFLEKNNIFDISDLSKIFLENKKNFINFAQLFIENLSENVLILDNGFNIIACNSSTSDFIKTSKKNLIQKNVFDVLSNIVNDEFKQNFYNLKIKDNFKLNNYTIQYPTNKDYHLNISAFSIKDNKNEILFSVLIIEDITEKENNKILLQEKKHLIKKYKRQNKLRMESIANICHELRTPLNIILSAMQIINLSFNKSDSVKVFNSKVTKYFSNIKQNCLRLLRIINNLIDITKIDTGYFDIHFSNNNIISTIENIVLSAAPYIENKSINLIFDTNVEEKIMAFDKDKIERIILNLISNSVKFTNPGGTILITLTDKGTSILISVKDNGIGIPKDKLNVIFDRYKQIDSTLSKNCQGSGIGLSLVKSLVSMHDGTISVKSTYGKGTEFIIELPAKLNPKDNNIKENKFNDNLEKINIEFSDIQ